MSTVGLDEDIIRDYIRKQEEDEKHMEFDYKQQMTTSVPMAIYRQKQALGGKRGLIY